jgi:hypothetical protein
MTALVALTPITLTPGGGSPTSLTAALAAAPWTSSNTGITFSNSGHEVVFVQTNSTGTSTVTSDIGTTVLGEGVASVVPGAAQALSTIAMYGPYQAQYDEPGSTNIVEVDFGTPLDIAAVVVVRIPGVI